MSIPLPRADDHHRLGGASLGERRRPGISKHDGSRIQEKLEYLLDSAVFLRLVTIP